MKRSVLFSIGLFFLYLCLTAHAADYTGMWWDVNKQGTGVYIDFTEGTGAVCGSWYLYDDRGNPQWVTFMGSVARNVLTADLYRFTGPAMGSEWDNSAVRSENVGSLTIDFTNPDGPVMNYEIDRVTGTFHLSRFSSDLCRGSLWWDVQKQGQGVAHFHFSGPQGEDQTGLVWYVYDKDGNSVWYTAIGDSTATTFQALRFTGPPLGEEWDSSLVKSEQAGTIKAVFDTGAMASQMNPRIDMDYTVEGITGHLSLEPFLCPVAVP